MNSSNDDEDGERLSRTAKLETDFSLCLVYLQKYKQHGDTVYTAIHYRLRNVIVDLMLQLQGFYRKDCYSNIVNEKNFKRAV